ncbi:acyl-CoA dehydrogenase family protein [Acrocarpospora catenulata]|uniref:acyl-CoA dehydrogenase family protein n=1 Tax=Acrocarpospora catenulata TaxID=2836182 RepID=UPI001BD9CC58|nr:acyl-CoA dehydrogenase family protein [Acrocarpospora catenulata]
MSQPRIDEDEARSLARALVADLPPARTPVRDFLAAQFDRGLAWINHPPGHGGLGADVRLQAAVNHVIKEAGGPDAFEINPIGHGMCAPTLVVWGTEEQKRRHLRPLFTGEEIWCQLFSEPGAGSDVAGLAARARRDGAEWVADGQKVWTTMAHRSSWGLLIARTDPDAVKHQGLTAFLLDMSAPGVEVRPLYQLTGEAEFNEVFLDGVRIPDAARLGRVGDGWKVVLTTLMNERVSIGGVIPPRGSGPIARLVERYRELARTDPATARLHTGAVADLWVRAEVLRLANIRLSQLRTGDTPGPEGSISKIIAADLNKDVYSELVTLMGAEGLLYESYDKVRPVLAMEYSTPQKAFLRSRANSIEGGTSEVMKNVLAERVLGLPGDPRADKDVPWRDIPRS